MNFKKKNGITLVSLAVTIVVLTILAGVTTYNLLGDNGAINTAELEKENIEEKVETTETKIREMENVLASDGTHLEVPIGINVSKKTLSGTSSISISANATQNAGYDITYEVELYRKGETTPIQTTEPAQISSGSILNFKAENLSNNYDYEYKIILTSPTGERTVETGEIALKQIEKAEGASKSTDEWTNQNITVTLPTRAGFTTKYQIGDTLSENDTWYTYNNSTKLTVENNETIWYRYSDGVNVGEESSIEVANIDKQVPELSTGWLYGDVDDDGDVDLTDADMAQQATISQIELTEIQKIKVDVNGDGKINALDAGMVRACANGRMQSFPVASNPLTCWNATINSFKARLSAEDTASGLDKVIWHYKKASEENYQTKEETLENSTTKELLETTIESLDRGTEYTVYAEVLDVAGNISTSNTVNKSTRTGVYQIAFNGNGAEKGTVASMNMVYGTPQNLNTNAFTKIGYKFTGWNTAEDGTGTSYTNEQSVDILTDKDDEVVTLYAQWEEAKVYAELFDVDGNGTGETLVFNSTPNFTYKPTPESEPLTCVTNYNEVTNTGTARPTWSSTTATANAIITVDFVDVVYPKSTAQWFRDLKNLTEIKNIDKLKTDLVVYMNSMFYGCINLNTIDVSEFNTSNATTMSNMFYNCAKVVDLNVSNFNTEKVTDMNAMFQGCTALVDPDVSNFVTDNVTDMGSMFRFCNNIENLDVSNFNTDKVTLMRFMFQTCSKVKTLDVSNWNTEKVTNMSAMFQNCSNLTELNVSNFNTEIVTDMSGMFQSCSGVSTLDVSGFDTNKVATMASMFYNCKALTDLDVSNFNTSKVTNMDSMFNGCGTLSTLDVSGFETGNVTNMQNMFYNCSGVSILDVSGFETGNVTNMQNMFRGCSGVSTLDVSGFETVNVTNMANMFNGCSGVSVLDVSGFETQNVNDMSGMFRDCRGLSSLNLSGFDTRNLRNMYEMFRDCKGLLSLNVSNFDTSNVYNMQRTFFGCSSLLNLDVSSFDTSAVTTMYSMFEGCSTLTTLNLSIFDTSNVSAMNDMFRLCEKLTTSITIRGTSCIGYTKMFEYACTASSAQITVYCDSSNQDLVQNMIATKSNNSNVVLGGTHYKVTYEDTAPISRYAPITRYSHTANIDNNGIANNVYGNNLNATDTITIPGASRLNIEVWYSTEGISYDWLCIYDGSVTPSANNFASSKTGKLGGGTKVYKDGATHETISIDGNTAKFYFKSNGSGGFYGYYAVVTGYDSNGNIIKESELSTEEDTLVSYTSTAGGTIGSTMTNGKYCETGEYSDYSFVGWYTGENGTGTIVTSEYVPTSDITLYAYYEHK